MEHFLESDKSGKSRMLPSYPLYFTCTDSHGGEVIPHDQTGFILEHHEWVLLKSELDAFFNQNSPESLAAHNKAKRIEYHLDCDEECREPRVEVDPSSRPPRWGDAKIRRRLIRERGLNCEDCGSEETRKTIEMHHVIGIAAGGKSEDGNLKLLCHGCHLKYR